MKTTKYLTILIAIMETSLSFGASIDGLDAAYSKDSIVYDGTSGDALTVSPSTTIGLNNNCSWTMAFTVSNLSITSDSNVGLLFTYNTSSYNNLEGIGYQLTEDGNLTLCVGGYNYNGNRANSSWKTQTVSNYSDNISLTLFYTFNAGDISISVMLGNDTSTLTTLTTLSGSNTLFSNQNITQINFSAKDTSASTWNVPDGITGEYTLNNFDLYTAVLTEDQMAEYALSAVPEPAAASLGLLGLGIFLMRRRRA